MYFKVIAYYLSLQHHCNSENFRAAKLSKNKKFVKNTAICLLMQHYANIIQWYFQVIVYNIKNWK